MGAAVPANQCQSRNSRGKENLRTGLSLLAATSSASSIAVRISEKACAASASPLAGRDRISCFLRRSPLRAFPTSEAVNEALRGLLRLAEKTSKLTRLGRHARRAVGGPGRSDELQFVLSGAA